MADKLLFVTIVVPCGTIYIAVDIDLVWAVLGRIPCNRDVKEVPRGVICTGVLASEDIRVIWFHILKI